MKQNILLIIESGEHVVYRAQQNSFLTRLSIVNVDDTDPATINIYKHGLQDIQVLIKPKNLLLKKYGNFTWINDPVLFLKDYYLVIDTDKTLHIDLEYDTDYRK